MGFIEAPDTGAPHTDTQPDVAADRDRARDPDVPGAGGGAEDHADQTQRQQRSIPAAVRRADTLGGQSRPRP